MGSTMTVLEAVKIVFFLHPGDKASALEVVEKECREILQHFARSQSWRQTTSHVPSRGSPEDIENEEDLKDEEECTSGYDEHPSALPPVDFTSDDIDEAIQTILLKAWTRTVPASAHVPDSEESARAYLKRVAINAFISVVRQKRPHISFDGANMSDALQARVLRERPPKPKSLVPIAKEPLFIQVGKDNADEVLKDILRALQQWVEENMLYQTAEGSMPTDNYGRKESCLVAKFCRAVETVFNSLRKDAKVGFVQDFQRMFRLTFGFTDYKEEVLEECKRKNVAIKKGHKDPNYKKVRDSLDQRKHRLLGRLRDALLNEGLSTTETQNIITAFLSKDTEDLK